MKENRNKNKAWMTFLAIFLLCLAVVLIIWFLLKGETRVTGSFPDDTTSVSLSCEREGEPYPFFGYDESESKKTKINMIFQQDKLHTISLIQTMIYNNSEYAAKSETLNRVSINENLGNELSSNSMDVRYTVNGNTMQMVLSVDTDKLSETEKKFFLIEKDPYTFEQYENNYISQNFICKTNNN